MVIIADKELNNEIESYIEERREEDERKEVTSFMDKLFGRGPKFSDDKAEKADEVESVDEEHIEEVVEDDEIEQVEEEPDFYEDTEDKSLFKRIYEAFTGTSQEPEEDVIEEDFDVEEEKDVDVEKVEEFLKELHPWLEQFRPKTMKRFKKSTAFEKYTDLLDDLDMVEEED